VAQNTKFNGIALLDGSFTSKAFQVGADANETVSITSINSARTAAIGGSFTSTTTSSTVGSTVIDQASNAVTINGVNIVSTVGDGVSTDGSSNTSAKAKAAAINATAGTGVTATATTVVAGTAFALAALNAGDGDTITVSINGQTASFLIDNDGTGDDTASTLDAAVSAINGISGATGVTAANTTTGLTLTAADVRNIVLDSFSSDDASGDGVTYTEAGLGLNFTAGTAVRGTLSLTSTSSLGIQTVETNPNTIGAPSDVDATGSGVAISNATVATVSGANEAITAVDNALSTISSIRSDLGSYQSRFESVVANLQTTAENLSASRSRIVDADFAAETANLTKAQILQQSGIAMLAQANAIPQNVLALLH
jgi:flagellin